MGKFKNRILSVLLSLTLIIASVSFIAVSAQQPQPDANSGTQAAAASDYGLTESIGDGTILHAWCWSFNTIKSNLKNIAQAGFSTIQTSPINECLVGENGGMQLMGNGKWYYHYQPIDYTIGNYQLGTEQEFKELCDEAHKYGIKIIVDVVANHMTSYVSEIKEYIRNMAGGAFHSGGGISDYGDRYNSTQKSLLGLVDLNTQNPNVQLLIQNYLKKCVAAGADGFRYDAAKHVELPSDDPSFASNFWPVVLDNGSKFQYGEILQGTGDSFEEYAKLMNVTASSYGGAIRQAARNKNFDVNNIKDFRSPAPVNTLVTWVESHDNYCGDGSWRDLSELQVKQAWAVLTARSGGTPLFFSRPDGSSTTNQWGNNKIGAAGSDAYKDVDVAAVNNFRNTMVGLDETMSNPNDNKSIVMIERANKGAVIVNSGEDTVQIDTKTKLAPGTYFDKVTNTQYVSDGNNLKGTINANQIIVLSNVKTETKPYVSVSQEGGNFRGSLNLTLSVYAADTAYYQLDGKEKVMFKNGDVITLGANLKEGGTVTLSLSAENEYGSAAETYTFTKLSYPVTEGKTVVYFENAEDWNDVNIYAYGGEASGDIAKWPGVPMQKLNDGIYAYVLPDSWKSCKVMFNSGFGGSQFPGPDQAGLDMTEDTWMYCHDGIWEDYKQYIGTETPEVKVGDVTGDGAINIQDVLAIQKYLAGIMTLTKEQVSAGDVNFSGALELGDALEIQKYIANIIDGFHKP